jgi:hypothetical protein
MKTHQIILTKSYTVIVNAKTKKQAKDVAEFYTGDIQDISTPKDRKRFNFSIEEIECKMNESLEAEEIKKD